MEQARVKFVIRNRVNYAWGEGRRARAKIKRSQEAHLDRFRVVSLVGGDVVHRDATRTLDAALAEAGSRMRQDLKITEVRILRVALGSSGAAAAPQPSPLTCAPLALAA